MEGTQDPLNLTATTEKILWHPIFQLPLEGGYNPLAGMQPALAPPYHPNMFLSNFHMFLCLQLCRRCLITYLVSVFYCCYIDLDYRDIFSKCKILLINTSSNFLYKWISSLWSFTVVSFQSRFVPFHQTHNFIKNFSSSNTFPYFFV